MVFLFLQLFALCVLLPRQPLQLWRVRAFDLSRARLAADTLATGAAGFSKLSPAADAAGLLRFLLCAPNARGKQRLEQNLRAARGGELAAVRH